MGREKRTADAVVPVGATSGDGGMEAFEDELTLVRLLAAGTIARRRRAALGVSFLVAGLSLVALAYIVGIAVGLR